MLLPAMTGEPVPQERTMHTIDPEPKLIEVSDQGCEPTSYVPVPGGVPPTLPPLRESTGWTYWTILASVPHLQPSRQCSPSVPLHLHHLLTVAWTLRRPAGNHFLMGVLSPWLRLQPLSVLVHLYRSSTLSAPSTLISGSDHQSFGLTGFPRTVDSTQVTPAQPLASGSLPSPRRVVALAPSRPPWSSASHHSLGSPAASWTCQTKVKVPSIVTRSIQWLLPPSTPPWAVILVGLWVCTIWALYTSPPWLLPPSTPPWFIPSASLLLSPALRLLLTHLPTPNQPSLYSSVTA